MPNGGNLGSKRDTLNSGLRGLGRTLVAYSGGVDSAFLAWAAHQVLGNDMLGGYRRFCQPGTKPVGGRHCFRPRTGNPA